MIVLFWASLGLFVHTYLLYPLSLPIIAWFKKKNKFSFSGLYPKISILMSAYNEEIIIEEKILNCLDLEYPPDKLEIIIGSDASTDNTNTILKKYSDKIISKEFDKRTGKASVLNRLATVATGEILLLCDANTMLLRNAVQKIAVSFSNPKVGCVCGKLILNDHSGSSLGKGESVYWSIESEIKKLEGRLGIVIGANGGIYALKKSLYRSIPEKNTIMDDFFITIQVLMQNMQAVYEPLAIGSEETSIDIYGEFKRKVRIGQANFNSLKTYIALLNPKYGLAAYGFFSHKFLRWFGPVLMAIIFLSNIALLNSPSYSTLFRFLAAGQCLFYTAALFGYIANEKKWLVSFIFTFPFYFTCMNIALFYGMVKSILGTEGGMWDRVERSRTE